jgi:DNA helicase-2/ATP-dependent DNA helicase PcrA
MINLELLNPPQREAIVQTDGPVLVLAGAGSGKTSVLTHRIAYILDTGLAGPNNILAMTFTNKAAGEMKERITKLLEDNLEIQNSKFKIQDLPWAGTFHSICVKILRRNGELVGLGRNFIIYDSTDQTAAIKEAMKRLNISIKDFNPNAIHSYISSAKNELIDPVEYSKYAQGYFQRVVADVYPKYQEVLKENNAVDFDDLLLYTVKLFTENQGVLEQLQNMFRYILVDEYQDTNHAQYIIVSMLAAKHRNICVVGDDDQSIYAFRGATIKNILNFEKDYPEAKVIKLEQNYRSTKKILEASYQVISKNRGRKDKKLWTENDDGENITVYKAFDEINEGRWIVEKILELNRSGIGLEDISILYRTNAQSRALEESFITGGIPYRIIGGIQFYERREIKDLIAYLRVIYNPKDNTSLERIINVPKRGIGDKTVEGLYVEARKFDQSIVEFLISNQQNLPSDKVGKFASLISELSDKSKEKNIVDFLNYLLDKTGYIDMLDDGSLEGESRIENIKELISVASRYENEEPSVGLENFLNEVSLLERVSVNREQVESVTLMTIHAAKGLEFDHVFVVGMEENLFPHSNSIMDEKEMEEERRLAYVAITRAKKNLYLTHASKRKYFGRNQNNPLSRFVQDIDPELVSQIIDEAHGFDVSDYFEENRFKDSEVSYIQLEIGDKVKHEYFGKGVVKSIDDSIVLIDFGAVYGVKELLLEYAKLEKI